MFTLYDVSNNKITGNIVVGQVGLEWTVAGFGDFSKSFQRNRHADAQLAIPAHSKSTTSPTTPSRLRGRWARSGWNGRFRGSAISRPAPTRPTCRCATAIPDIFEVDDIVNNTITSFAPHGAGRSGVVDCGLRRFSTRANETDMLMRNSNTGAFEVYDISNNTITPLFPMGQAALGVDDRGLWRFLRQCQRNRHARRHSNTGVLGTLSTSATTPSLWLIRT